MKAIVLLNKSAGTLAAKSVSDIERLVRQELNAAGIDAEVRSCSDKTLEREAIAAARSSADMVVAGGGDGTLSTVARALAGTGKPLGVLPLGTRNHFARDLNIPLDVRQALLVIAAGHISNVDAGQVNDRVFINNSSLGVYPRAVLLRDAERRRRRLSKWAAMLMAVLKAFRRFPLLEVRLDAAGKTIAAKTPLVFVGNNQYQMELLKVGSRECLDRGQLSLYVAHTQNRWGMFKLTVRALFGRLKQARDFESLCTSSCWIDSRRHRLHVAVDGEVVRLRPPLHYRAWPAALRIFVPPTPQTPE